MVEVEEDSEEAYRARRQLVRLLVDGIMVGRRACTKTTYRLGPPPIEGGEVVGAGVGFVPAGKNGKP